MKSFPRQLCRRQDDAQANAAREELGKKLVDVGLVDRGGDGYDVVLGLGQVDVALLEQEDKMCDNRSGKPVFVAPI